MNKPKQVERDVDRAARLRRLCQEYIDQLAEDDYVDDDLEHYIFEAAMELAFGKGVWKWINARLRGEI